MRSAAERTAAPPVPRRRRPVALAVTVAAVAATVLGSAACDPAAHKAADRGEMCVKIAELALFNPLHRDATRVERDVRERAAELLSLNVYKRQRPARGTGTGRQAAQGRRAHGRLAAEGQARGPPRPHGGALRRVPERPPQGTAADLPGPQGLLTTKAFRPQTGHPGCPPSPEASLPRAATPGPSVAVRRNGMRRPRAVIPGSRGGSAASPLRTADSTVPRSSLEDRGTVVIGAGAGFTWWRPSAAPAWRAGCRSRPHRPRACRSGGRRRRAC